MSFGLEPSDAVNEPLDSGAIHDMGPHHADTCIHTKTLYKVGSAPFGKPLIMPVIVSSDDPYSGKSMDTVNDSVFVWWILLKINNTNV